MSLQDLVIRAARVRPGAVAVHDRAGATTYAELDAAANRLARKLAELGVGRGDRVALWLEKSARGIAVMQAALRLGAAYVPIDPLAPRARASAILRDCGVRVLVTTAARAEGVADALQGLRCLRLDGADAGWDRIACLPAEPIGEGASAPEDLAYILYTSGSTGRPKGVCISHRNALSFVEWAAAELGATPDDRLSNHAPFHFDLSVLDLYVAFFAGARTCLVPEDVSYAPRRLVEFLVREQITIWYSVPSAIVLMMEQGGLLEAPALPWRAVLFAGEVFPVKHLRRLRERHPSPRYLNLYGPTETNVCTFLDLREAPEPLTAPVAIGRACCGDRVWASKPDGSEVGPGEEGELIVDGPTVMIGYWGQPPQAGRPYATGDVVTLAPDGAYHLVGRRDQMVKVRGYRIETGDVEAALLEHPAIREAAVTVRGSGLDARIVAFVGSDAEVSLIDLKRHCAERLPRYMIIDDARRLPRLPRTPNGKIDRVALSSSPPDASTPASATEQREP